MVWVKKILFARRIHSLGLQDRMTAIDKIAQMRISILASVVTLCCLTLWNNAWAAVKLPAIFQNNMVLQRGKPLPVWGWADPSEKISIMLNGRSVAVVSNKHGRWRAVLPALEAGGPYEMIIQGKNKIVLHDVLIGDVWVCGGQSNMQWNISQTGFIERDTAFIRQAEIRLYTVRIEMDYLPREDIKGSGWKKLTNQDIDVFSAVAYHFGKYLHRALNIPIGLISDNLGASAAEAWMSNEALLQFDQFKTLVEPVVKDGKNFAQLESEFEKMKDQWYQHYYAGNGFDMQWFKPEMDVSDWKPIKVSGNTWETVDDLRDYDGAVWFRTKFDLPENYDPNNFTISLCQIDDYDVAWLNGNRIGETYGKHNHRNYQVPNELLKAKDNALVVRVFDLGGIGGFTTSSFWGNPILWGDWFYKKDAGIDIQNRRHPKLPNATPFSSPAVLYNANIAPLTSFPIAGVIWYQGESNVERAYEYRELFPALIQDWRRQWTQGEFPFLFVQLANYEAESTEPRQSTWAELREAQAMTLAVPNSGMATAIDIGEANDIHPKNKEEVGKRLGLVALKVAYGRDSTISGPTFRSMKIEGNRVVLSYDNAVQGLVTKDRYGYVRGFQVAGEDRKFYWAQAIIKGATVEVTSSKVPNPKAVRYAWDNNPGPLDLYNSEGLPAVPFRTDDWKGITSGVKFIEGPRF